MKARHPGRPFCGILLIEHIGDIIACEPIIEQLRTAHPNAFIVWLVNPRYAALLASHPVLDAIVFADSLLTVERIVEARIFDIHVDLHVNSKPTDVPERRYQNKSGDPSIDDKTYLGKGSLLRSFSLAAGIEPRPAAPTMYLPNKAVVAIDRLSLPDRFVVVHATPNYGSKDWSPHKWRDLARHIVDHYETHVIEIGLKTVIDLQHPRVSSLCGKLSIVETAELIRRCAFFVGIDSGPAHMANAWRRPALLLFGRFLGVDTFNPFDGYYSDEAETVILRYPGLLREQPVSRVVAALEASPRWEEALGDRRRVREGADASVVNRV
jgi:heptosyltransferase-3